MNLTAERSTFLAALSRVSGIVARKSTIPIISNVLIDAHKSGTVSLRSTNLDMEATAQFQANVTDPGVITVPSAMLFDIMRNLDNGADLKLSTSTDDPRAKLQSGRSRFSLPMLPADSFPSMSAPQHDATITLSAPDLATMLATVAYAQGSDATRFYFCGVFLHTKDGRLTAAATNSHKIARAIGPETDIEIANAIAPTDFVAHAERLLKDEARDVVLSVGESMIALTIGDTTLTSKLISDTYPEYGRVIPEANPHTLKVAREQMEAAARRAMIAGQSLKIAVGSDSLAIAAKNQDSADAMDEISAEFDGPDTEVAMNGAYLIETLAHMRGDVIEMRLDGKKPVRFYDPEQPRATFTVAQQWG